MHSICLYLWDIVKVCLLMKLLFMSWSKYRKKSKYEILSTLPMISAPEVMSVLIQLPFSLSAKTENWPSHNSSHKKAGIRKDPGYIYGENKQWKLTFNCDITIFFFNDFRCFLRNRKFQNVIFTFHMFSEFHPSSALHAMLLFLL